MNGRKKVAILLPWMKIGGTNKIGLNFIKELLQYCDVTLVLSSNTGELLSQIPDNVEVIIDEMRDFRDIFTEDIRKFRIGFLIKDMLYYLRIKLGRDSVDNYSYLVKRHGYICDTEFDCAVSYHGQSPERLLNLIYRTHAKKKAAWIHGEFSNSEEHCRRMERYYGKLDGMFFVSKQTMDSFFKRMTFDREKCAVYYNPLNKEEVFEKAKLPFEEEFSSEYINVLTVGRLSSEKGQDMIPEVTKKLLDEGYKLRWYIIGDGDTRPKIEELIRKNKAEDSVFLLGTKINPYCYMRACDIYVQPSYTEGYSTTICEAGILGKAIIGTKPSGGIREQIDDGENGLIVDATTKGLFEGIRMLADDEKLRHRFETNIQKKNFDGKGEIRKFLAFCGCEMPKGTEI